MTIPRQLLAPHHWPTWSGVLLMALLSHLPRAACHRLGAGLGWLFYWFARERRHICKTNLRLCFPHLSDVEQRQLLRRTMRDQGVGLMETLRGWFLPVDKLGVELTLHNEALLDTGPGQPGVLILATHFTCLDICGQLLGARYPTDAFYRQHKNPVLEWVWSQSRGRFGEPIHRRDLKMALRRLREGHRLFYLPDQDYGRKSTVFADFFGIPAATTVGTSTLAKGGRARVVFPFFRRMDEGRRYEIRFVELRDFPSGDTTADARRVNAMLEEAVLQAPEQYMWVHRRFKTRPPGQAKVY